MFALSVRRCLFTLASFLLLIGEVFAQDHHRFNFSGGAGFTVPTADAGSELNTGWNLDIRGGLNINPHLLADLDFNYNYNNLTNSALAKFGQPGGYVDLWSLTLEPVIRFSPARRFDPYVFVGSGLYHRGLTLTQPATLNTIFCDPFFGFCFPTTVQVNQVVASYSTYKAGWNGGGGIEYRVGASRLKVFAEARYTRMFTRFGPDLTLLPVTFGVRW